MIANTAVKDKEGKEVGNMRNARLIHHLDSGNGIYAWTPMIFDEDVMEAWRDEEYEDHWEANRLLDLLEENEGWLELEVKDDDGSLADEGFRDSPTSDGWVMIPAVLSIDEEGLETMEDNIGRDGFVVITALDD